MTLKYAVKTLRKAQTDDFYIALDVAIEACTRQTPETPELWGDGEYDGELVIDSWNCPNCHETYELETEQYKFCPNCGQAINWKDINKNSNIRNPT
jgi:Zn finger protein HypA/HybF involved in hydrogenase expression